MKFVSDTLESFTITEVMLWTTSVIIIIVSFLLFNQGDTLTLIASLIGVTSLIFTAKGNPIGQVLFFIFAILYGMISYTYAYYGEMVTYLGMSAPMAVFSIITWFRNPHKGKRSEVEVNPISKLEVVAMFILSIIVTMFFYFILKALNTNHLFPSTISVTTSFLSVYLTFRRNAYFALAYSANDIVLIYLWINASQDHPPYWSVVICFLLFLINDMYGFFNWSRIEKNQRN